MTRTNRRMFLAHSLAILAAALTTLALAADGPATAPASAPATASAPADALAQSFGFKDMEVLKLDWGLGSPIVADINGDGLNDIVVVNNQKSRIELLLQKPNWHPQAGKAPVPEGDDVNDIFGNEQTWRFHRESYPLDVAAGGIVVADLNNDGLADMAFISRNGVYVVLQPPAGASTAPASGPAKASASAPTSGPSKPRVPVWGAAKRIDIPDLLPGAGAIAAGDLNDDGRTDLAVLAADGVWVILQKDDGTLAPPVKYASGAQRLREVRIADIDGDGRADLVLLTADPDYPVRVRFQDKEGRLGPEVRLDMPAPAAFDVARLGKGSKQSLVSVAAGSGRLSVQSLAPNASKENYPVYTYPLPQGDGADNRDITAANLSGTGMMDVVATDPSRAEFLLFRASAKAPLASPERFPGMMDMRKVVAGDIDGSGKDSIIALSVKEKLIGISRLEKGRLTYPQSLPIEGEPVAMELTRVGGKPVLAYVAKVKDKFYLRMLTDLAAKVPTAGPELELDLSDKPQDLRAADIDSDGMPEFLIQRPYGAMMLVRLVTASVSIPDGGTLLGSGPASRLATSTAEAKTDKLVEVKGDMKSGLVSNIEPNALSIAPLGPKGSRAVLLAQKDFARALRFDKDKGSWQVIDQYSAPNPQSNLSAATAIRLGEDKSPTIFTYDSARGKLGVLQEGADATYRTVREIDVGAMTAKKVLAGNFGGGATTSVLVAGPTKLVLMPVVAEAYTLRKIAGFESQIKDAKIGALAVGDLNGDGVPDIVLIDQNRHNVEIVAFDTRGELVSATRFKAFEEARATERGYGDRSREGGEPRDAVIGDVTGHGKNDLILLVHDRLIIYPQD